MSEQSNQDQIVILREIMKDIDEQLPNIGLTPVEKLHFAAKIRQLDLLSFISDSLDDLVINSGE